MGQDPHTGGRSGDQHGSSPVEALDAEMFRGIAAASPHAIVAADAAGVVVWANPASEQVFGWSPAELVGQPITVLTTDEHVAQAHDARRRALEGRAPSMLVLTGRRKDGSTFDMTVAPAVLRDASGEVTGISAIASDVSETVRLERDLTTELARSRARFDQVGTPQARLDLNTRIVAINDAGCELLGWPREKLIGRLAADLLPQVDPVEEQKYRDLREGAIPSTSAQVTAVRGDGGEVSMLLDVSLVRDEDGKPRELALFARDLTELHNANRLLESRDAFFRALNRRASDVVIVTDAHARIRYLSPSVTAVLGYRRADAVGRSVRDFMPEEEVEISRQRREQLLSGEAGSSMRRLVRVRAADGSLRWCDALTTNCLDDPDIAGMVTNVRDVTAEIEAQDALRASEARFRAIAQTAQEGIVAFNPDGSVLFANDKLAELTGIPLDVLYARGLRDVLDDDETSRLQARLLDRDLRGPEHYEVAFTHADGGRRTLFVASSPLEHDDGTPMGSLGMVSDVTDARAAEAELRHRALHDSLTGLPNRALLVDRLRMAGARLTRHASPGLAVLFLDLDHFKLVNDSRGHEVGDRLLADVAARLRLAVRESDTVARLGGDEFAVVCEDADGAVADGVAQRVQDALAQPFDLDGDDVYVSASIGIALSPPYATSDLLRFADSAMYDAKSGGRSRVSRFDGTASLGSRRRLAITNGLREALAADALTMGYQAIVELRSRRLLGLEALLRWEHPTFGALPPDEVVHAAESAGLAVDLDRAVIHRAGHDLVRLRGTGVVPDDTFVSVNISPRSIQHQGLDTIVSEMLEATGLPATCLCLEITEHAIMDNAEHTVALLQRLTDLGVRLSIDDFGTGYNSLVHLQRLPLDVLKIDRSFVSDVMTRTDSLAIARSIVGLASAIGLETVAEGIEDEQQATLLLHLGARAGQGYLWGPAVRVDDVAAALRRWRDE